MSKIDDSNIESEGEEITPFASHYDSVPSSGDEGMAGVSEGKLPKRKASSSETESEYENTKSARVNPFQYSTGKKQMQYLLKKRLQLLRLYYIMTRKVLQLSPKLLAQEQNQIMFHLQKAQKQS